MPAPDLVWALGQVPDAAPDLVALAERLTGDPDVAATIATTRLFLSVGEKPDF